MILEDGSMLYLLGGRRESTLLDCGTGTLEVVATRRVCCCVRLLLGSLACVGEATKGESLP